MSTAAMLVIGDEILSGKVQDKNSHTLAQVLFEQGVDLIKIEVVPDDIDTIVSCVQRLSADHTYVFTSGGIGPTHDDKTYEAIAKAFDRKLEYHDSVLNQLQDHYRKIEKPLNEARKRMALLPSPCDIIDIEALWVPLVVVKNVYIFPGVPELFDYMVKNAKHYFVGNKKERVLLYTMLSEGDFAEKLTEIQAQFPNVAIGSYPRYHAEKYNVMVSLEGVDNKALKDAVSLTKEAIEGFENI